MQTWNHLACRRDAKAARHFCLSRTSGGSLTDSVSIHGWNKKTRHSLTKGFLSGGKGMWQPPKGQQRLPESQVISALDQGRRSQSVNSAQRGNRKNWRPLQKNLKNKNIKSQVGSYCSRSNPIGEGKDSGSYLLRNCLPCFLPMISQ